ncbi:MAG TPA: amino acid ABC transporter permease [Nocardioides sp.]|uniref:amino acid ABC transporter permease n=1 Tax=Nocardioides sp. TaxID=35761 RepID=UPI002BEA2391|nr:amino acid ABC transporter permease [Nocardioides sp.]HQR27071.1 amino acid ABC transporter permease [Nocardioides sp.]
MSSNTDIVAIPVRHYGRWVGAVVVLGLLGSLLYAFSQGNIDWAVTWEYFDAPTIVQGMWNTLLISVLAQALGIVLGVVAAVMRKSANPVTSGVAWLYIWFFRGTPVLLQLLLWYNLSLVFPTIWIPFAGSVATNTVMTPFLAALLGLGINEGAYMAEIVRAGINSVDEGQTEAAQALGLSPARTMRRVVLPQAMRVIIPPTGNEFINMLKTSSLAYAVQFGELLYSATSIYSANLAVVELLFTVSLWYLVLTSVFSVFQAFLERRFARGSSRNLPGPTVLGRVLSNLRPGRKP